MGKGGRGKGKVHKSGPISSVASPAPLSDVDIKGRSKGDGNKGKLSKANAQAQIGPASLERKRVYMKLPPAK